MTESDPRSDLRIRQGDTMAVANFNEVEEQHGRALRSGEIAAVIDVDDLQDLRHDPEWQLFYKDATEYRSKLQRAGRST